MIARIMLVIVIVGGQAVNVVVTIMLNVRTSADTSVPERVLVVVHQTAADTRGPVGNDD